jgi:thiol-disulfide isomerase/thioredoxin
MKPILFALVLGFISQCVALAEEKAKPAEPLSAAAAAEKLKADANDVTALIAFANGSLGAISALIQSQPDKAEKLLADFTATLDSLKPDQDAAKALVLRLKQTTTFYADSIELARIPLAEIEKQLDASPNDVKILAKYTRKLGTEVSSIARTKPDEADQLLVPAKDRIAKIKEAAPEDNKPLQTQLATMLRTITSLERSVVQGRKLLAIIGKDASSLDVEAWVNGSPLTNDDLKGKVVLLDFWAVWCGPCIATFPHLREWNEKYSDKGLVMIGLTRYYKYEWDDKTNKAVRNAKGEVTPEAEQEMLVKFAEHYNLHHRFAIQKKEAGLDEDYAVSGIPHVVVIDRQGKVRMIRIGSGPANAKDIGQLLESLLDPKPAAGG